MLEQIIKNKSLGNPKERLYLKFSLLHSPTKVRELELNHKIILISANKPCHKLFGEPKYSITFEHHFLDAIENRMIKIKVLKQQDLSASSKTDGHCRL